MQNDFDKYCGALNAVLSDNIYLVGDALSLADIVMLCEFALMSNEGRMAKALQDIGCAPILPGLKDYPALYGHMEKLLAIEAIQQDLAPYARFMGFADVQEASA